MNELLLIQHWHWWIAGVILMCAELLMPGIFLLWAGVAALVTGVIVMLTADTLPMPWQFLIFATLTIATVYALRRYRKDYLKESDQPLLNQRGQELIGQVFTLHEPIVDGMGRVKVGDSAWSVKGADADVGTKVRVERIDGSVLVVTSVST